MTKTARTDQFRKYRVTYAVTRTECYEIDAANPQEAEELAFEEGEMTADSGNAVNVEPCDVEIVTS